MDRGGAKGSEAELQDPFAWARLVVALPESLRHSKAFQGETKDSAEYSAEAGLED